MPLTDSAVLLAAEARGFFAAEGLDVSLSREISWATVRDKLAVGALDGAHMLAPAAIAASLGLASEPASIIAPFALNMDGAAVTLATRLWDGIGEAPAATLAELVARRQAQGASPLTFAVVFPFSAHNYLLRTWLTAAGIDPDEDVRIVVAPPSRMAELLAQGVIEGFCAGAPWHASAVQQGAGRIAARAAEVLGPAPDKVFAVPERWAQANPEVLSGVLRALDRAAGWCGQLENRAELAAMLAQPEHVGVARDLVAADLTAIVGSPAGRPQTEHALWILEQMQRWGQIGSRNAANAAAQVYRPDLYDAAMGG